MIGDFITRLPCHVFHPTRSPQPLQGHECRLGKHAERSDAPEFTVFSDLPKTLELIHDRCMSRRFAPLRNQSEDHRACDGESTGKHSKQNAPVDPLQRPSNRCGGEDSADSARGKDPAVQCGKPLPGKPERVRLKPGHQARADPQTDESPSDDQQESAIAPGEQQRTRGRNQQQ